MRRARPSPAWAMISTRWWRWKWIRAWVMAASAVSRRVSWIRWPRCNIRPRVTAFVTTTASSRSPSTRTAGSVNRQHLAAAAQCLGNAAFGCALHRAFRRTRAEHARRRRRAALTLGRDPGRAGGGFRSAGAGQPQPDGESPAAVVGARAAAVSHRGFQRGQLSGGGRRPGRGEEPVARVVPGRFHAAGQGAALQAAVLLRQRQHPGHPRHASRRRTHARRTADCAGRADERHASDARHSRAHAAADRSVRHALGAGLGHLPQRVRLHQSHADARGAGNLAGAFLRAVPAAAPGDHLPHQRGIPARGGEALQGRRRGQDHASHHWRDRTAGACACRTWRWWAATR